MTAPCPICGETRSLDIERREAVPVSQNFVFESREAALACPHGALEMRRCTACGFVWNARFDPALLRYDAAYDNDQGFSSRFRDHSVAIARRIAARLSRCGPVHLLEIGCGQGGFLSNLADAFGDRWLSAVGYDPAWRGSSADLPARTTVRAEPFTAGCRRADDAVAGAVLSRHVIEHVRDPIAFLDAIRDGLDEGTPLFVETPDADWILRNGACFDFHYEHCSLFTGDSLVQALERARFAIEDVRTVFDGQYLLATAVAGAARETAPLAASVGDHGYPVRRERFVEALRTLIDDRARDGGRVAIWGGGSKGVTLCLMLSDSGARIDCAIDINPRKQGRFMPMSGAPIVSPHEASRRGATAAIVMNPAYFQEIEDLCARDALGLELIAIDSVGAGDRDAAAAPRPETKQSTGDGA